MVKVGEVISYLILHSRIPEIGFFDVTEDLIKDYLFAYGIVHKKDTGFGKTSNIKFARRLAGLNLLKENIRRGASPRDIKAGHVYLISNPAFPLHYKIGVAFDVHKRLASYQTYSPYRDFILEKYDFVPDKFSTEKLLLAHPLLLRKNGEWVLKDNAKTVFDDLSKSQLQGI